MFSQLISFLSGIIFFILHVTGAGSFPKALSVAEEKKCLDLMQQGDKDARRVLIEHNLRLVAHAIKKYYANINDQDDLISIGTIGLIKAIDSFKPDKGIRLSSYASKCVENEVLMFFRGQRKSAQDVSINEPIDTDKDGNSLTIMDTMCHEDHIIDDLDNKMKCDSLYRYVEKNLALREREIIVLRYGLFGQNPLTQREVAQRMNISRSYVSRLEKKVLEKLRGEFDKGNK
ncbi:MAG: RNA polymerase sporulation sigma factor SigK [Oscillospiraceae bacterium]